MAKYPKPRLDEATLCDAAGYCGCGCGRGRGEPFVKANGRGEPFVRTIVQWPGRTMLNVPSSFWMALARLPYFNAMPLTM